MLEQALACRLHRPLRPSTRTPSMAALPRSNFGARERAPPTDNASDRTADLQYTTLSIVRRTSRCRTPAIQRQEASPMTRMQRVVAPFLGAVAADGDRSNQGSKRSVLQEVDECTKRSTEMTVEFSFNRIERNPCSRLTNPSQSVGINPSLPIFIIILQPLSDQGHTSDSVSYL